MSEIFENVVGFEWDNGNKVKNTLGHNVSNEECEEIFFDPAKKIRRDVLHSVTESRHILIGQTKKQRLLFLVFTIRKKLIRVISARDLNRKEYILYEKNN
jgi:uncharacterized DUF497 family protein